MLLDQGISAASASPRPRASQKNSVPREVEGFVLSRQVEGCTPATCKTYRLRIPLFFRYLGEHGGPHSLQEIERTDIERYLLHLQQQALSPFYIHAHFRALRAFFNWCVTEEFLDRSPMRSMKAPRLPRLSKPFLSEAQRDALLVLCPRSTFVGARNAAIIWLLWGSGMRVGECAGLQLADLDWDHNRVRVFGKGQRERWAPFTKQAKKAVWRYLSHRRDDHPQLWLTEERRPAGRWMMPSQMQRLIERAGLHGVIRDRHHIFRRTWAWRNLKAGIPIKYIMAAGGWATVGMLLRYVAAMESEEAMGANWQE